MRRLYKQDLKFGNGINGNKIGGNACRMNISDGFADVLTLHCSFECFQNGYDIEFIKEAERVLNKKGRLGIIPLYVDDVYFVKSGPAADRKKIQVDNDARWIWRDDEYTDEPFSRHYSPESFKKRIYNNLRKLKGEILYFSNLSELRQKYIGQRIYCHFMFRAMK